MMKKRERNHGTESSRIKNIRKKIDLKCLEMKEKMKQHKSSILLNEEEINNRVLIFREMLFEKEEIPDEDHAPIQPIEKANDSTKSKTSKKSRKNKGEKEQGIVNFNGKSKTVDLNINLKRKRTNSELSSKLPSPHSQIINGISPALSQKSKVSPKSHKNAKSSPSRLHSSVISDAAKDTLACRRSAKNSCSAEALTEPHRRNSRSMSAEKRNRSYSRSMSPHERARDRSSDRHSSCRRSVHRSDRSLSRTMSRSRSPSIRRRKGSPSHLDRRRITSARKRPVPYYRPSPSSDRSGSWSSYSRYSRSKSRSSFGASPSPAALHRLRCSRHGHAPFSSLDLTQ